jgi:hypothetical protein
MLARAPAEHPLRQQIDAVSDVAAHGSLEFERTYVRTDLALGIAKDRAKMLGTERVLDAVIASGRAKPGPDATLTHAQKEAVDRRQAVLGKVGTRGVRAGLEAATRSAKTPEQKAQVERVREDIKIVQRQFRAQVALNAGAMLDQSERSIVTELGAYGLMTAHATPLVTKVSMEVVELNAAVDEWIERSRSRAEYRSAGASSARDGLAARTEELRALQKPVVDLQRAYVERFGESPMDAGERRAHDRMRYKLKGAPLPKVPDISPEAKVLESRINAERHKLTAAWIAAEREHPILAAHRGREGRHPEWIDLGGYSASIEFGDDDNKRRLRIGQAGRAQATKSTPATHERAAVRQAVRRLVNIRRARLAIKQGLLKPLKLTRVVRFTEKQMLIAPGSAWAAAVKEVVDPEPGVLGKGLEFLKDVFDFAMLLLTVLPTPAAPAAVLWEVGRNAYVALDEYVKHDLDETYSNTDLDIARSLSDRVPSLTGFVMALIAAGLAAATLKSTFEAAAAARRGLLAGDEAALRELDELGQRYGVSSLGDDVARAEGVPARRRPGARADDDAARGRPAGRRPPPPPAPDPLPAAGPHVTERELRKAVRRALKNVKRQARGAREMGKKSEIDFLANEIEKTDKPFAAQVRLYYKSKANSRWVENQIVRLWRQARANGRSPADELMAALRGDQRGVNRFQNTPGLKPKEEYEEFRRAVADDRLLFDEALEGTTHGAWIHMFDEWLGDILFGAGEGLKFRQKLATLQGPSRTMRVLGQPEFEKPFWSRLWDALFDEVHPAMHQPEKIAPILGQELGMTPPPPP